MALDHPGELDLQAAGKIQLMFGLHDVRDAALARLRVDPDDRLVGTPHVVRVDRQVRHGPRVLRKRNASLVRLRLPRLEPLPDRVLMGAGEGGLAQAPRVRGARGNRDLIAALDGTPALPDV